MLSLQHSAGNQAMAAALQSIERPTTSGAGRPLEDSVRTEMEQRFGHDFSDVRVHADRAAAHSAKSIDAKAYTVGSNIVFNDGRFAPDSSAGKHLLAHELAHVVQARRGATGEVIGRVDSASEHGADRAAASAAGGGGAVHVGGGGAPLIARMPGSGEEFRDPHRSPVHPVAGGKPPGWMNVGREAGRGTPFGFLSESPALQNWNESTRQVLERFYGRSFKTFAEAEQHFRDDVESLPQDKTENLAKRLRDRARKAFLRREGTKPSFDYSAAEKARLKGGKMPIEGQQFEHLEEIKPKVRARQVVPGHPERALDPGNIYLTEGGKGGTAPKGSPHAEKWRTVVDALKRSREIGSRLLTPAQTSATPSRGLGGDTRGAITPRGALSGAMGALQVYGAIQQFKSMRARGIDPVEATITSGAQLAGGLSLGKIGPKLPAGSPKGGGISAAINIGNAVLQMAGAPKGVTDVTSTVASATGASFIPTVLGEGARGFLNIGKAIGGNPKAIDRQVKEMIEGKGAMMPLSGYARPVDMAADVLSGQGLERTILKQKFVGQEESVWNATAAPLLLRQIKMAEGLIRGKGLKKASEESLEMEKNAPINRAFDYTQEKGKAFIANELPKIQERVKEAVAEKKQAAGEYLGEKLDALRKLSPF